MKNSNINGLLTIQISNTHKLEVIFQPVNGTVWMDRNELCNLFGCYMKDIDRCLGEIVEKNMLSVEVTCKYDIIAGGRHIRYDITAVNLTAIITMAFRLETPHAKTLRTWFVEQFIKMKSLDRFLADMSANFQWN